MKCRRQRGSQGSRGVLSQLMWMMQKHRCKVCEDPKRSEGEFQKMQTAKTKPVTVDAEQKTLVFQEGKHVQNEKAVDLIHRT